VTEPGAAGLGWRLNYLANILATGGIVAHPTEGVFGLGCDPFNDAAVRRLIDLKRRDAGKGLIVLGADVRQLEAVVHAECIQRLPDSDSSPTTYVVRAALGVPSLVRGGRSTVAVRICSHPPVAALCAAFGGPIVSTSANLTGVQPLMTGVGVRLRFGAELDGVLALAVGEAGRPSRVIDLDSGAVLRA
jgi:L-threonylcarbamoyladenylate synthase